MSKYNNKKITVDGMVFDSQKEYRRWCELKLLERAGKISKLKRQVTFELVPPQYENVERYGKSGRLQDGVMCVEHAVKYVADFVYIQDGKKVVEDVKGCRKGGAYNVFAIKRKLMLYLHGIKILET